MPPRRDEILFADRHFTVSPCRDCALPGYVVVTSRAEADSLAALPPAALAVLGPLLARTERAVSRVMGAERVYCASFGESGHGLHFHVFPRTAALVRIAPREAGAPEGGVNGPVLLDWARRRFRRAPSDPWPAACAERFAALRSALRDG